MELFIGLAIVAYFLIKERIAVHKADKYAQEQMELWRRNNKK